MTTDENKNGALCNIVDQNCINNAIPRATRCISLLLLAALMLTACMPKVVETEDPRHPVSEVLVLTGAGMVSSSTEDPRYEKTWLQVAKVYSRSLSAAMTDAGLNVQLYIKDAKAESTKDTLARLVADDRKDALIQVTVTHLRNSAENTIYLEAQLMPLAYQQLSNGQRRVLPQPGPARRYPMLSTTGKDMRDASISELARAFVKELRDQGYLK